MTLNYYGQEIDLSGVNNIMVYNLRKNTWEQLRSDLSKVNYLDIYGIMLPVISREELIAYKKILARPVDLVDVEYLEHTS